MSEEKKSRIPRLRMIFIALAVANVLFFAYAGFAPDTRSTAASRIEELQINPGRIKLMGAATRGPAGQAGGAQSSKSGAYRACLEWGPFASSDIGHAESALARFSLAQTPIQRPIPDSGGAKRFAYYVREPEAGTVAQIAELQRGFPGTEIKAGPCPF